MRYYKDLEGYKADVQLVHYKNTATKGPQMLPISPQLLPLLTLLEKAAAAQHTPTSLLFCMTSGQPYQEAYFSTRCTIALSFGDHHLAAKDYRHMFVTAWRDFVNTPHAKLAELNSVALEEAAANMMLNSTSAWDKAYDDTNRDRGMARVMALWPAFVEYVKHRYELKMSEE